MNSQPRLALHSLIAVSLLSGAVLGLAQSTSKPTPPGTLACLKFAAESFPKFTRSGVWTASGNELILLDNYDRTLLRYTSAGKARGSILTSVHGALRDSHPRALSPYGNSGFLLQAEANAFWSVDDRFSYKLLPAQKSANGDKIEKVYDFAAGPSEIVAFADVHSTQTDRWSPGFIRFSPTDPEKTRWLLKGVPDEEKLWYSLAMPYVAMLGNTAYALRMNSPYALYRNDPQREGSELVKLSALDPPRDSASQNILPSLPDLKSAADITPIMAAIREAKDLPVGLYAQGQRLFVLYRTGHSGRTEWSIRVVDEKSVNEPSRKVVKLNVDADFISLVPGPRFWAIVTKDQPVGMREQHVTGVHIFPAAPLLVLDPLRLPGEICRP